MTSVMLITMQCINFVPTFKPTLSSFKYYGDTKPLG